MSFGVYVHIPYCLQRCVYCDFATVETSSSISRIVPPLAYIDRVKKEISLKGPAIGPRVLDTVYFGGGTPSAIDPNLLISVVETLKENGFVLKKNAELTLEINPGTLTTRHFEALFEAGFNRFSVGVQSFDDFLLKQAHRLHSAEDTRNTLEILNSHGVNYSADILFSMPNQTLDGLSKDLDELVKFNPPHVSPYALTVPEGHPFSMNRAPDAEQVEMFSLIENKLKSSGLNRYEISNFSKPKNESRHNLLYWNDCEYWGLGNSSHSYLKTSCWGTRFWNPRSLEQYVNHVDQLLPNAWSPKAISPEDGEVLEEHQAMTDFFHTSLRMHQGLRPARFQKKFSKNLEAFAAEPIAKNLKRGLLERCGPNLGLTAKGILLSNIVFTDFTYLGPLTKEF